MLEDKNKSLSDENKILDKSQTDSFFQYLKSQSANKQCADCERHSPVWASTSFGIFLCSDCAAKHRALGVNISKIKSTLLDKWTVGELRRLWVSGNNLANELGDGCDIRMKYTNAEDYKSKIDKLVQESLKKQPGCGFINKENKKPTVVVNKVKKVPVPKFRDCEIQERDCEIPQKVEIKEEKTSVKPNAFVIKKKSTPTVTKNGSTLYTVGDVSSTRLGFGSAPNKE
ncbi:putative ADP-ribosylation factor GTPase-activating protein AGD8 [Nosema granulosis]|uniref:ADP-ribosylation factor GTPase-activating protein AGD8 n=1 Tax=Nosema granulosis TaxID=83296 RepID=A0A9P6GWN9_9MICR|nr:putative ADP-ribosylation factor GTPase-activating protein AGD8 [Nosema granulosis]